MIYYNWLWVVFEIEVELNVEYVLKDVLFVCVDYVVFVLLYMKENYYMIGVVEFVKMKLMVMLINIVCGGIVDDVVLVVVLCDGMIVVVGFDVYEGELSVYLVLFEVLNVVLMLYIVSVIEKICCVMVDFVVDNLIVVLGEGLWVGWLLNLINFDVIGKLCV